MWFEMACDGLDSNRLVVTNVFGSVSLGQVQVPSMSGVGSLVEAEDSDRVLAQVALVSGVTIGPQVSQQALLAIILPAAHDLVRSAPTANPTVTSNLDLVLDFPSGLINRRWPYLYRKFESLERSHPNPGPHVNPSPGYSTSDLRRPSTNPKPKAQLVP